MVQPPADQAGGWSPLAHVKLIMSLPSSYLRRRPNGFLFRRVIPAELRPRFGRTEVIKSLMRITSREAKVTAQYLWVATDALFRVVRQMPELSSADIEVIQAHYLDGLRQRAFADHYDDFLSAVKAGTTKEWLETVSQVTSQMATSLLRDADRQARWLEPEFVIAEAKKAGYTVAPETFDEHRVQKALLETQAVFKFAEARHLIEWRDEYNPARNSIHAKAARAFSGRVELASKEGLEARLDNCARMKAHPLMQSGIDVYPPTKRSAKLYGDDLEASAENDRSPESNGEQVESQAPSPPPATPDDTKNNVAPEVNVITAEVTEAVAPPQLVTPDDAPASVVREAGSDVAPSPPISVVWKEWINSKLIEKGGKWSRVPELYSTLNTFIWIEGNRPIDDYKRQDFTDFKLKYMKLPADYKNVRYVREGKDRFQRSYDAVVRIADEKGLSRVCPKTFNKHPGNLRAFFEWCRVEEKLPSDFPDHLNKIEILIEKTPTVIQEERSMVSLTVIEELFLMSIWTGRHSAYYLVKRGIIIIRDARYWVPLGLCCHGMRREELCQLKVKHVKKEEGIWNFDLRDPHLKLKNTNAHRQIPLHKGFIALGFLEARVFGRSDEELLFPELNDKNAHNSYGNGVGRSLMNYIDNIEFRLESYRQELREEWSSTFEGDELEKRIELKVAERVAQIKKEITLHGFRHTLAHMLRNNPNVKDSYVDELLGHAPQFNSPEARRYGKKVWLENLKAAIDAFELPIDFEGLRKLAEAYEASVKMKPKDAD